MKTKNFAWLIIALMVSTLALPRIAFAQGEGRYGRAEWRRDSREDRRRLEGTWYLNGERDKPCMIVSTRDGFEARNERGEASRLVIDRYGSIRARDWEGGLRGEIRRQNIEWANGTTWTRFASRN
jgi:hypothetical protein